MQLKKDYKTKKLKLYLTMTYILRSGHNPKVHVSKHTFYDIAVVFI
ncbi:hypothetical protein ACINWC743_1654 [Acinetobacter sp. WC-743]|nr:hypothetical protein ACINWC743_1654 [Acinetobacter sp. WC-743]